MVQEPAKQSAVEPAGLLCHGFKQQAEELSQLLQDFGGPSMTTPTDIPVRHHNIALVIVLQLRSMHDVRTQDDIDAPLDVETTRDWKSQGEPRSADHKLRALQDMHVQAVGQPAKQVLPQPTYCCQVQSHRRGWICACAKDKALYPIQFDWYMPAVGLCAVAKQQVCALQRGTRMQDAWPACLPNEPFRCACASAMQQACVCGT